jgi:hypothetical protein
MGMTQYDDAARTIGSRDQDDFRQRFRKIAAQQVLLARYYRRLALIARHRGDTALYRELVLRAIQSGSSAYLLAIDCELADRLRACCRRDPGNRKIDCGMRIPDYPADEAEEAVETLASLHWLYEQDSDPVGSALADVALDNAAGELHRSGLLDVLITRAAQRYWPRRT